MKHMDLAIRKVHRIYSATIPAIAMIATWIVHVPACYHHPPIERGLARSILMTFMPDSLTLLYSFFVFEATVRLW
jgi:hypothetical protein